MQDIIIWGFKIPLACLSQDEVEYLNSLPPNLPTVKWVWDELDRIWNQFEINNKQIASEQPIGEYYSHPVWLMNGIFTVLDPVSLSHREAIARYLAQLEVKRIADYGGGFGELALAIIRNIPDVTISIVEPYPSRIAVKRLQSKTNIKFIPDLSTKFYDVVVAQDVLEHVDDPVQLAYRIADSVQDGGFAVFANCFAPVIQCHLPSTFHLRYTFPWIMKKLGMRYMGIVESATHAQVYKRIGPLDLEKARKAEYISRMVSPFSQVIGPIYNISRKILSKLKHLLVRT